MKLPAQIEFFVASFGLFGGMVTILQRAKRRKLKYIEIVAIMTTAIFAAITTDMLFMGAYSDNIRIGVAAIVGFTSEQTLNFLAEYWLATIEKISSVKIILGDTEKGADKNNGNS